MELTKVKPDLRPSTWKTASHYGGLVDQFAPIRMGSSARGKWCSEIDEGDEGDVPPIPRFMVAASSRGILKSVRWLRMLLCTVHVLP